VFRPQTTEIGWTYPDWPQKPTPELRARLDGLVAGLKAAAGEGAMRRARQALADALVDAAIDFGLNSWGGWRLCMVTTEVTVRPGREQEARAWLRTQGCEKLLTKVKLARFLDRNGLFAPDELFLVRQKDVVRRV
jgi:hypothetical protein